MELDLEFSADGVPILMHDETVDRTTNGSGSLRHLKWIELSKLDAAAKHRLRLGRLLQYDQEVALFLASAFVALHFVCDLSLSALPQQGQICRRENPNSGRSRGGMCPAAAHHLLWCQRSPRWGAASKTAMKCTEQRRQIVVLLSMFKGKTLREMKCKSYQI